MATDKSKSDPATPHLCLDAARQEVGLQATWEIDALVRAALLAIADMAVDDETHETKMLLRGLLSRVCQLNSSAMSILGDDNISTERLQKAVVQGTEVFH